MYVLSPLRWFLAVIATTLPAALVTAQTGTGAPTSQTSQASPPDASPGPTAAPKDGKKDFNKTHILWVIPNYRSEENGFEIRPLTPKEKFRVAFDDSFDPSAFLVAGVFAGSSMAQNQYKSFGQGAAGFAKYYGGAFADQGIGNFMTEALFPIALRQDPRYFYKGKGGFWRRTGYALSREVITRSDDGHNQFNVSELAGNFAAAGISNVYYPASDRTFSKTANKWGQQIGLDALFNVTKEFWPDVRRRVFHKSD
jgi:hypothetical protein